MSEALTYFYSYFRGFYNLAFNSFFIESGVSFGWICITCLIFGILLNTILKIPHTIPHTTISTTTGTSESNYVNNKGLRSKTITKSTRTTTSKRR